MRWSRSSINSATWRIVIALHSSLDTFCISLVEGPQQGDPFEGLLFLYDITYNSTVYCFSPYDGFYGRRITGVPLFNVSLAKIGIQINVGKCGVISKDPFKSEGFFAGFCTILPSDAIIPGAPLTGLGSATDRAFEARLVERNIIVWTEARVTDYRTAA